MSSELARGPLVGLQQPDDGGVTLGTFDELLQGQPPCGAQPSLLHCTSYCLYIILYIILCGLDTTVQYTENDTKNFVSGYSTSQPYGVPNVPIGLLIAKQWAGYR